METLSNFMHEIGRKFSVYFLYICAQIFVLASLLLSTTSIVVHVIFMIVTIIFYFATALKNPGVYEGAVEPNHEDLNNSKPEIQVHKERSIQKRWQSQKQCQIEYHSQKRSNASIQKQEMRISQNQKQGAQKIQKKASIQKIMLDNQQIITAQVVVEEAKKQNFESKKQIKNEIFNMAKSVFSNFAIFRSKRDILQKQIPQNLEAEGKAIIKKPKEQRPHQLQVPVQNFELMLSKFSKLTAKQQGVNSMIGRQDFGELQIHSNIQPEIKINKVTKWNQPKTLVQKMSQIKRYCRICEAYQPLRVRHCHNCDRCIATFDHHCPWMANCIGQKNKIFYITYLVLQTLQLFTIMVDLSRFLSTKLVQNSASVGILLMVVILVFVLLLILLCFHFYLIAKNLTTWELLSREKIQYLSIFDKKKVQSPFSKGFFSNFRIFWKYGTQLDLEDWTKQLNQDFLQCLIQGKKQVEPPVDPIDSDRRPFRSERLVRS